MFRNTTHRAGSGTTVARSLLNRRYLIRNLAMSTAAALNINPLFLRHDLMIELGRLDMVIEDARTRQQTPQNELVVQLETRRARINEALSRLPA
jgi:hypothetical protein